MSVGRSASDRASPTGASVMVRLAGEEDLRESHEETPEDDSDDDDDFGCDGSGVDSVLGWSAWKSSRNFWISGSTGSLGAAAWAGDDDDNCEVGAFSGGGVFGGDAEAQSQPIVVYVNMRSRNTILYGLSIASLSL